MSAVVPPRLVIQGLASWNPNTLNNVPEAYDKTTVTAADVDPEWAKSLNADETDVNGGWNRYGANECEFLDVTVRAIHLRSPGAAAGRDPLLGQPVRIAGCRVEGRRSREPARIVDVDPKHPVTGQIFFDHFAVGGDDCGFDAAPAGRMFVRWPVLERNLNLTGGLIRAGCAAVTWQAALPRATLRWRGLRRSPGLRALKRAVEETDAAGLTVRFASYRTIYYQTATWKGIRLTGPDALAAAYHDGFSGPNPALGMTLGNIGVWPKRALATTSSDRVLLPGHRLAMRERRGGRYISPAFSDRAESVELPEDVELGPAFAVVDHRRNVLILDLGLTFPEQDLFLEKADLGSFTLQVRDRVRRGRVTQVGRPITFADYRRAAYELNGGVVELALQPGEAAVIAGGDLELVSIARPTRAALREQVLVAETDDRAVYLDEGQTRTVRIRVFERGTAPTTPVGVRLTHHDDTGRRLEGSERRVRVLDADGKRLRGDVVRVGRDGRVRLRLRPRRPGTCFINIRAFALPRLAEPPRWLSLAVPYLAVRVLPFDTALERRTPDAKLTFPFLYEKVLRVYDVLCSSMTRGFDPRNPETLARNAVRIRAALEPERFESSGFIPVTRDLSAGKRRLLSRWLARAGRGKR